MQMTYGDQMKDLGREEAIRPMQELVLSLLANRFGRISKRTRERILAITLKSRFDPVPKQIQNQVRTITSKRNLTELAQRVTEASSLDELDLTFPPPAPKKKTLSRREAWWQANGWPPLPEGPTEGHFSRS